jgi:ligand-binding sensor domain-containing protein
MFSPSVAGFFPMNSFLADLGLERNPNVERGLFVWSLVVIGCALLTLWLAIRPGGILNRKASQPPGASEVAAHGWPFMKRTLLNVTQLFTGLLAVYGLVRLAEPRASRPPGWYLISPPHEATVLASQGNIVWVGGKEGLFAIDRQSFSVRDIPPLKARDLRGVRALLAENDTLWIACRLGLFCYRQEKLEQVTPRDREDLGPVTALRRARDGALWIGVREGAWRLDNRSGEWRWFGRSEGLTLPSVDVIYQDQDGNLWFGSNEPEAAGLFRFDGKGFSNQSSGLTSNAINGLMEDHTGVLWVATGFGTRGSAASFVEKQWLPLGDIPGLSGEKIRSLFEDSQHELWFCSEYNGVAIRSGNSWKRLTQREGLPGSELKDLFQDDTGTLWLATERGLGCLRSLP